MKKILFSAYSLDIGGIETALVELIKELQKKKYEITLVLEKKEGIFLNEISNEIEIIEYEPSKDTNIIKRKLKNFWKKIKFMKKYKNKYDFSASFATYSNVGAFVARIASKNSYLWGHANYKELYKNDINKMKKFFKEKKYNKFKGIIFVSEEGRKTFIETFPKMEKRTIICNNLINKEKIEKLAEEKIEIKKEKEKETIFINVGRHDERQKKLSRIIEAAQELKKNGYKFKILFVGDGIDEKSYKKTVKEKKLEENVKFLGKKKNPYPYYKIADCVILTSDYEGYPVVFLESMVLNKPIITTKVSDYKEIEGKYGYVTTKEVQDIYEKMKKYIEEGFQIKEKFNAEKYNRQIIEKIEKLI